jgi:hypothetical protein
MRNNVEGLSPKFFIFLTMLLDIINLGIKTLIFLRYNICALRIIYSA